MSTEEKKEPVKRTTRKKKEPEVKGTVITTPQGHKIRRVDN